MDQDVLSQGVFFALQEPARVADPYPFYHRLRSHAPFHWDFVLSGWFLTRYADVRAALLDPRLTTKNSPFDVTQLPKRLQEELGPLGRVMDRLVLYNDSPDHERLRRPLNRVFNPAAFERMRPKVEAKAQELLEKAERLQSMDVVSDYSRPLANHITGELLGLPAAGRTEFIGWCDELRKFTTAPRMGNETILKAKAAVKSFGSIRACIRTMIADRTNHFADDAIGRAFAVEGSEALATEEEIFANCVFFLHSGARNMAASITNAVLTLLRHPKQFARLREHPQSLTIAVEELLRYETPVQIAIRGVPNEVEFAQRRIGPQHLLVLLLGAANRDPDQFPDPDRLDLMRHPNRHLAFGLGAHGCVGASMARFGVTTALRPILNRKPELRLAPGKLQWNFPAMRRTVRALPVLINRRISSRKMSRSTRSRRTSRRSALLISSR